MSIVLKIDRHISLCSLIKSLITSHSVWSPSPATASPKFIFSSYWFNSSSHSNLWFLGLLSFQLAFTHLRLVLGVLLETLFVGRQYSFFPPWPHGFPVRVSFHFSAPHLFNDVPLQSCELAFRLPAFGNLLDARADGNTLPEPLPSYSKRPLASPFPARPIARR